MPIYEYICKKCTETFALLQWQSNAEETAKCPKCGSEDLKKLPSSFSCPLPGDEDSSSGGSSQGFSGGG